MVARSSRGLHLRASAGDQLIVGAAGQEGVVATTRLEVDPLAAPRRREGGERRLAAPPRVLDRRPLSLFPRRPCARPRRRGADSSDPRGAKENPRGGSRGSGQAPAGGSTDTHLSSTESVWQVAAPPPSRTRCGSGRCRSDGSEEGACPQASTQRRWKCRTQVGSARGSERRQGGPGAGSRQRSTDDVGGANSN